MGAQGCIAETKTKWWRELRSPTEERAPPFEQQLEQESERARVNAEYLAFLQAGPLEEPDEEDGPDARARRNIEVREATWTSAETSLPLNGPLRKGVHATNYGAHMLQYAPQSGDGDCRGVASIYHEDQARWKVRRVPVWRVGYCSRWDEYLPALELAFDSKVQASTGASPFTLVYGTEAHLPIDCALDDARPATLPAVGQRAERMKAALDHARTLAEIAQAKQKRLADRHRRLLELKAGDQLLLATEGLQLRSGMHKLTGRYIGPFRVMGNVNDNAVVLDLPPLLGALHSTFNISRLKPYRHSDHALFPGRPQRLHQPPAVDADTNGVAEYEVKSVLAQRGSTNRRELLIRWKGYGAEHDEWQPRTS
jgi:hypothetical protein